MPRRVKRFVNLYRLMKMTLPPDEAQALGRDMMAGAAPLLLNLTIATGAPRMASAYFALLDTAYSFVALETELRNRYGAEPDLKTIERAIDIIDPTIPRANPQFLDGLKKWADLAWRYSFVTTPLVPPSESRTAGS